MDARAAFIEPQYVKDGKKVFRFIKKVYNSQGVHTNYNYVQAEIKNNADNSTLTCTENTETYTLTPVDREQGHLVDSIQKREYIYGDD